MIEFLIIFVVPLFFLLLSITALLHIVFQIPYVPSSMRVVNRMIRIAELKPTDVVFDLGCGDGRLLIEAAKKGARAEGFEIAPLVYFLALLKKLINSTTADFQRARIKIHYSNLFSANVKRASVIFCYLLPGAMKKLSIKLQKECKKGTRIVTNTFRVPDMKPVKVFKKNRKYNLPTVYLYKIK